MPFGSIHAFKNQDRKKSLEASGNRSVYLTGDAVWGQECGPALLQEVGPLFKVVLGVVHRCRLGCSETQGPRTA